MTDREKMSNWVKSLKPGDEVIFYGFMDRPEKVLTVSKVTPSGIVRTNGGSFKQASYGSSVFRYGGGFGSILPYTEETAKKAREHEGAVKAEENKQKLIRYAKVVCYDLCYGKREMTTDIAWAILDIVKEGESSG